MLRSSALFEKSVVDFHLGSGLQIFEKLTQDSLARFGLSLFYQCGFVFFELAHAAKVLLLTDPNSGIDVLVQRTRSRGIVSGSLDSGTILKYVKRSEDIQEGDRLITSGIDGIFPKGMMVGTVIKVRKQHIGLFQFIEVLPAVQTARIENVLIVAGDGAGKS